MTRRILILSGNLPGLITAYRLIPYGFLVTILDHNRHFPSEASPQLSYESTRSQQSFSSHTLTGHAPPLILHGFYHSTWSLLEELALEQPLRFFQKVGLEFVTSNGETVGLPRIPVPFALHPIIQLAFFSGLSWSDRWHMINFLEKKWEGYFPPDHNSDTLPVESWLRTAGQSVLAIQDIWNPLCRFFLGCNATEASLGFFLEVLSRLWLSKTHGPELFLAQPDMLDNLQQELRRVLIAKGVKFATINDITRIQADTEHIQSIVLPDGEHLSADAYVSTLPPQELIRLLPERAPARFSCFSHMAQLQEVSGGAIQLKITGTLLPPRLILNSGLFDWVTSQTLPNAHEPTTVIMCVNINHSSPQIPADEWLNDSVWPHIQGLFKNFPEQVPSSSCKPQVTQSLYPFLPCQTGLRTFRPLSSTPLLNLFLAGPWIATPLPPCLESTVLSAYGCARALAEYVQVSSR